MFFHVFSFNLSFNCGCGKLEFEGAVGGFGYKVLNEK